MLTVDTLRVAIVADLLEEGWPSMDLVADMLMSHVAGGASFTPTLMRPRFAAINGNGHKAPPTYRRIAYRFWSYPRWLRQQPAADVYHIVDHSYAHLAHHLPAERVVVTCHDTDAFRSLLPSTDRESVLPRWLVRRVLSGLQRAAAVVCDSEVTRNELVSQGLVPLDKTRVLPVGVDPDCTPAPERDAESTAAKLTGRTGSSDLLHVGSTIPRKRIDVLLETLALVAKTRPDVRLWRVGGPFTPEQAKRARELGIEKRIVVLPFVTRKVVAALYRRAALVLLPSEREGFGLPVVEAMAAGIPLACSDIEPLRSIVGDSCIRFDPLSDEDMLHAMEHLVCGKADVEGAKRRAREFTWARCAAETLQAIREAAAR